MGYDGRWTSRITITPPLTLAEINAAPKMRNLVLDVSEEPVATAEGESVKCTASGVRAVMDRFSGYHIDEDLQALVDCFGVGHAFDGHIDAVFDDKGQRMRIVVRDGIAIRVRPQVVWPDGDSPTTDALADKIMAELHDRAGVLDGIDDEVLCDIRDSIAEIIRDGA